MMITERQQLSLPLSLSLSLCLFVDRIVLILCSTNFSKLNQSSVSIVNDPGQSMLRFNEWPRIRRLATRVQASRLTQLQDLRQR